MSSGALSNPAPSSEQASRPKKACEGSHASFRICSDLFRETWNLFRLHFSGSKWRKYHLLLSELKSNPARVGVQSPIETKAKGSE